MESKNIEEAVASIETAAGNIREALKHDAPRNGITLEELIQLLDTGKPINLVIPMNGMYWETKVKISARFLDNGSLFKSTDSFRDPSVVLSRKVRRVKIGDNGLLWVYLEGDK